MQEDDDLETIWADDLFNRKEEALHLIAYIDSVVGRPQLREDKRAFTIAVEAGYGSFCQDLATLLLFHSAGRSD